VEPDFYAEYNKIEDRHWWFVGRREILLRVLAERLGGRTDLELLDFGCGTGTIAGHLARFGTVHAVDGDAAAVAFCRARGVERVTHIPDGPLPFANASLDVVTTFDVLEHIEDDFGTLVELRRVLRPGGTLLAAVPAFPALWGLQDEVSHHKRRYVRPALVARVEDAGFRVHRASYFNTLLFGPIAAVRLLRRVRPAPPDLMSDFAMGPPWLNGLLSRVFRAEAGPLAHRDLPFGVSVLVLAERVEC